MKSRLAAVLLLLALAGPAAAQGQIPISIGGLIPASLPIQSTDLIAVGQGAQSILYKATVGQVLAGGGGGSGTVNPGIAGQLAYYATSTNAVSGDINATISNGALTLGQPGSVAGSLALSGSSSGKVTLAAMAAAGTWTLTLPNGPGSSGQVLETDGSGNASWGPLSAGTVTSVTCGTGLAGGTFTNTGTCSFAAIANHTLLANISGGSLAPSSTTLTALIDDAIGSTRGSLLERGASGWTVLAPGTNGQVLTSAGAGADPAYQTLSAGSGTVSSGTLNQVAVYPGSGTTVQGANLSTLLTAGYGVALSGTTVVTPSVPLLASYLQANFGGL